MTHAHDEDENMLGAAATPMSDHVARFMSQLKDGWHVGMKGPNGAHSHYGKGFNSALFSYLGSLSTPIASGGGEATKPECPGADDPEERCPKPPHECTCWEVELDYHPKHVRAALSTAGAAAWRPIAEADNSIATVQQFGDVTLRNSYPVWVRDEDGRVYEAVWTDHKQGYWWDIEGESPVDPVEYYPHPLASPPSDTEEKAP